MPSSFSSLGKLFGQPRNILLQLGHSLSCVSGCILCLLQLGSILHAGATRYGGLIAGNRQTAVGAVVGTIFASCIVPVLETDGQD